MKIIHYYLACLVMTLVTMISTSFAVNYTVSNDAALDAALATPITSVDTITIDTAGTYTIAAGSYDLSKITITADDVIIDGGTATINIHGDHGNDYGVDINAVDNVAITNATFIDQRWVTGNTCHGLPAFPSTACHFFFKIADNDGFTLRNVTLNGIDATGETTALDLNSTSNVTIDNVTIERFGRNGVAVTATYPGHTHTSSDIVFADITIDRVATSASRGAIRFYTTTAGAGGAGADITGIVFSGANTISNITHGAIVFDGLDYRAGNPTSLADVAPFRVTGNGPVISGSAMVDINSVSFTNIDGYFVGLSMPDTYVDALTTDFDGITRATQAGLDAIESQVSHDCDGTNPFAPQGACNEDLDTVIAGLPAFCSITPAACLPIISTQYGQPGAAAPTGSFDPSFTGVLMTVDLGSVRYFTPTHDVTLCKQSSTGAMLSGWTMNITGQPSQVTDATGCTTFTGVVAGSVIISETAQANRNFVGAAGLAATATLAPATTTATTAASQAITVNADATYTFINEFVVVPPVCTFPTLTSSTVTGSVASGMTITVVYSEPITGSVSFQSNSYPLTATGNPNEYEVTLPVSASPSVQMLFADFFVSPLSGCVTSIDQVPFSVPANPPVCTAPVFVSGPTATTTTSSVTLSFGTDVATTGTIVIGGTTYPITASNTTHALTIPGLTPGTTYTATITMSVAGGCNVVDTVTFTTSSGGSNGGGGNTGGGGGGRPLIPDDCPAGDFSPSYYDDDCGIIPTDGDDETPAEEIASLIDLIGEVGTICTRFYPQYASIQYGDTSGHTYQDAIELLTNSCLVNGRYQQVDITGGPVGVPYFYPDASVTIAEAVKIIIQVTRIVGGNNPVMAYDTYSAELIQSYGDIDGHWVAPYAEQAYRAGLFRGTSLDGSGIMNPESPISYVDSIQMMVNAMEYLNIPTRVIFTQQNSVTRGELAEAVRRTFALDNFVLDGSHTKLLLWAIQRKIAPMSAQDQYAFLERLYNALLRVNASVLNRYGIDKATLIDILERVLGLSQQMSQAASLTN